MMSGAPVARPELPPIEARTAPAQLTRMAAAAPERPLVLFEDVAISYAEAERLVNRYARALADLGVTRGSHVSLMLENRPEYLWSVLALGRLGAVGVPLNTALRGQLLRYHLVDADLDLAVLDGRYQPEVCAASPDLRVVRIDELERRAENQSDAPVAEVARGWDPALIMYTSGTTGPSKGVLCPHAHPTTVGFRVGAAFGYTPDDRLYACLPLFHGNALWYSFMAALTAGATLALARRFSASNFWTDVIRHDATAFNAIMSMASILQHLDPCPQERENALRLAFIVPLPRERAELERRWGVSMVCNYAMTELFPVAVLRPGQGYDKPGTSGTLTDAAETVIVDEHDLPVAPGVPGEVCVRPAEPWTSITEYYGKPEATAAAFRNGWFHTGDRASVDADGHFHFVDRAKDAIRRRGENISAHEIEMVLGAAPGVADVAAVAVPSSLGEDDVAVYVRRNDDGLGEVDLLRFAVANLPYYMVPRYVAFVTELPTTATHKIAKYQLRERAASHPTELWDRDANGITVTRDGARFQAGG